MFEKNGDVMVVTLDDGKANAVGHAFVEAVNEGLDAALADAQAVLLCGRDGVFSAGFDLNVMKRGGARAIGMLGAGYGLPPRVLSHPKPVIVACNGHCLAMGVFLMLSADYVLGTRGDYKISANEVAIGMTMPRVAAAMLKHRLKPSAFQRAVALAQYFDVEAAREAGFFDELVGADELAARARQLAEDYKQLDALAHRLSKRRMRRSLVRKLRFSRPFDLFDAAMVGVRRAFSR